MQLRVLIYIPMDLTITRGTPIRALNIARFLSKKNCDVHVVASNIDKSLGEEITFHKVNIRRKRIIGFVDHNKQLIRIIKKIKPSVIYAIAHNALNVGITASKFTRIPIIVELHSNFLEERVSLWKDIVHGSMEYKILQKLERFLISKCDAITVVCEPLKDYYASYAKKIYIVPGGVNLDHFNPNIKPISEIYQLKGNSVLVMYSGNFRYYQGIDMLLEAASDIVHIHGKKIKFILIGNLSNSTKYAEIIKKENLEHNVFLLDEKAYDTIPTYLSASDILVVPRPFTEICHYAFPSKLPEYMGMGKAVVATDLGDASKLIKSQETGILIQPTKEELVNALMKLGEDSNLRLQLGKNARQFVEENYSWDKIGDKLKLVLEEIKR
jgi:glycosyltransferase involved in cell wall biosynthesis